MPTREAEILFAESDKLQPNLDSLRNLARSLAFRPHGYLRVGCLPSHGMSPIPDAVRQFRVAHPDVSLGIQTRHTTEPITALFTRELDIGMAVEPRGARASPASKWDRLRVFGLGSRWAGRIACDFAQAAKALDARNGQK